LKFEIERIVEWGEYCIVQVHYEGCTNFEGKKISVYKVSKATLLKQTSLDPHFCPGHLSPIARFLPTGEGWSMAIRFVKAMHEGD
jgi:hypothetical protein